MVNIGNFDISNIELISPSSGTTITLPYAFQWSPRLASLGDSYEFDLYDPVDGDPYFYTDPPLGYVNSYTLAGRPPGFANGRDYVWEILAYSPDGGTGVSYWSYYVAFTRSQSLQIPKELIPGREKKELKNHPHTP